MYNFLHFEFIIKKKIEIILVNYFNQNFQIFYVNIMLNKGNICLDRLYKEDKQKFHKFQNNYEKLNQEFLFRNI